jgi:hypothetical protein
MTAHLAQGSDSAAARHPAGQPGFAYRLSRTAGPVALLLGPVMTVAGFALHPTAESNNRAFVAWIDAHATQWAAAHLLIGIGLGLLSAGIGSALRLADARGATFLTVGVIATAIGTVGMGYDAIAHGMLGYALTGQPALPLALSVHIQSSFLSLPFEAWANVAAVGFPLGVIVLGIGALRSRRIPIWSAIVLMLGPVGIQFAGAGPLELLGALPLVIGFAAITRAALAAPSAA